MRASIGSACVVAFALGAGCESTEEHVATFASYRQMENTWVGPTLRTVVLDDDGDFNSLQRVAGLDWHWGETITLRYLQTNHDTSGTADAWEHSYELIEVLSRVADPPGTHYTLTQYAGQPTFVHAQPGLMFEDYLNGPQPERIACEPALCNAVTAGVAARVVVELTEDPAVPLRVVSVTPIP